MDSGNARITVKHITRRSFQEITFPVVSQVNGKPAILYYAREERKWIDDGVKRKWLVDTLVYMFGDFVEYNKAPAHHAIGSISYRTGHCFGKCPVFDLKIKSDRSAILEAREFNDREGVFTATIDPSHFDQLVEILNYIDVATLDSSYSVPWTDAQSCVLTVTFEDGRTIKIRDYGLLGTYGLQRTYRLLFDLRTNQVWK
ncbi:MAG: hypothetical protein JSS89_05535 [Bacteroidetes bacterium]|nr:hypothetical protein [Bacteroidota bacterium]